MADIVLRCDDFFTKNLYSHLIGKKMDSPRPRFDDIKMSKYHVNMM